MNSPNRLDESAFHQQVDRVLEAIDNQLETRDADIDSEINGGILTLEFGDGSKVIVNRQTPNREIWVAAKSGGFHFRFDGQCWRDTRTREPLETLLSRVIGQQNGKVTPITI